MTSFLKTTGGKGLHVVVPIQPRTEWDDAKAFCRAVAEVMVRAAPDRFIATTSKAAARERSSSTICGTAAAQPRSHPTRRGTGQAPR